jgi:hypothetical protein
MFISKSLESKRCIGGNSNQIALKKIRLVNLVAL